MSPTVYEWCFYISRKSNFIPIYKYVFIYDHLIYSHFISAFVTLDSHADCILNVNTVSADPIQYFGKSGRVYM